MQRTNLRRFLLSLHLVLLGILAGTIGSNAAGVALKVVGEGYVAPVGYVPFRDQSGRAVVIDQVGVAYLIAKDAPPAAFLDVRSRMIKLNAGFDERGLLGFAFHPDFANNRRVFAYYSRPKRDSAPAGFDHTGRLAEFKVTADFSSVDLATEKVLFELDEPQFNHNGGPMVFGPDGFLYIGFGDGGQGNDTGPGHAPEGNGQNLQTFLGKILRLDVNHGDPYGIPSDNPFAAGGGRPEIFAYGLRNPWGISFDRGGNHEMFEADPGQDAFEEINIIVKGGNYGWRIREGFSCFDPAKPLEPPADCPKVGARGEPLIDPIVAYKNFKRFANDPEARGISAIGGYVYRGQAIPALQGKYVFADWSRSWAKPDGVIYVATRPESPGKPWSMAPLDLATHPGGEVHAYITAFGESADGELYVLTNDGTTPQGKTGRLHKLVPANATK